MKGKDFPWGAEDPKGRASVGGDWSVKSMKKIMRSVGSFAPNGYGLHDMAGNVWEWCTDWHDRNYYKSYSPKNPKGPPTGTYRVIRGGGCCNETRFVRCATRNYGHPGDSDIGLGFRLCMDAQ